ncbi:hypothetical protein CEXT_567581 [Caerostris extrusa]|uniref:Uncharacterized protein n=1 Tax=Caerostris extrusa TaxID=172846 RepID=A0AAV4SWI4_CAEEX|nr:hypothetical protein CEXT_567581 [Caerostris extrusa]
MNNLNKYKFTRQNDGSCTLVELVDEREKILNTVINLEDSEPCLQRFKKWLKRWNTKKVWLTLIASTTVTMVTVFGIIAAYPEPPHWLPHPTSASGFTFTMGFFIFLIIKFQRSGSPRSRYRRHLENHGMSVLQEELRMSSLIAPVNEYNGNVSRSSQNDVDYHKLNKDSVNVYKLNIKAYESKQDLKSAYESGDVYNSDHDSVSLSESKQNRNKLPLHMRYSIGVRRYSL